MLAFSSIIGITNENQRPAEERSIMPSSIVVPSAVASEFSFQESGRDEATGLEVADVVEIGFDNHGIPEYTLVVRELATGKLYACDYSYSGETDYNTFNEYSEFTFEEVERSEKVIVVYNKL